MTNDTPKSAPHQSQRRRPDWLPGALAVCVWLCTLPFVFLLIAPWLGARVAIAAALVLLGVIGLACWAMCGHSSTGG